MITDTHVHYSDKAFDDIREDLLAGLAGHGIGTVIECGDHFGGLQTVLALANKYPFMYAAIGVHPDRVAELDAAKLAAMEEMCRDPKTVAVGEIGLDYHRSEADRAVQKEWFAEQFRMAKRAGLPVIIHSRDAAEDTMNAVKREAAGGCRAVLHCYSYSPEQAQEYVSMGIMIGVGGVVTFKNGRRLKETVEQIPLSFILLETDCPYLAPEPYRGRRNSSLYLPYVIQTIAEIKGISDAEVIEATAKNAEDFFHIDVL